MCHLASRVPFCSICSFCSRSRAIAVIVDRNEKDAYSINGTFLQSTLKKLFPHSVSIIIKKLKIEGRETKLEAFRSNLSELAIPYCILLIKKLPSKLSLVSIWAWLLLVFQPAWVLAPTLGGERHRGVSLCVPCCQHMSPCSPGAFHLAPLLHVLSIWLLTKRARLLSTNNAIPNIKYSVTHGN